MIGSVIRWLAALLATAIATMAPAQTMPRDFAEPMSWATLRDRLQQLAPARPQWADLEAAHTVYLQEMDDLHTGPIARWLASPGADMTVELTDPDAAATGRRERASLEQRLASIDDDFFAHASQVLGDSQQRPLERMRLRRARDRMLHGLRMGSGVKFELRDHVDPLLLTDASRDVLFDWEDRRTASIREMKRLNEARSEIMQEAMEDFMSRIEQMDQNDIAAAQAIGEEVQRGLMARLREARAPLHKAVAGLRDHTWRGVRTLGDHLPIEAAHRLRMVALSTMGLMLNEGIDRNIRAGGLSKEDPRVQAILLSYWDDMASLSHIAATEVAALPEPSDMFALGIDGEDDGINPWMQRHEGMQAARSPLQDRIMKARRALLELAGIDGPQPSRNVAEFTDLDGVEHAVMAIVGDLGEASGGSISISSSVSFEGDIAGLDFGGTSLGGMHGYAPLPPALRGRLIRDLALDSTDIETLDAMIADHAEGLKQHQQQHSPAPESRPTGHQIIFSMSAMSQEGQQATARQDDALFDQLEALGDVERVRPHRLARRRSLQSLGGSGFAMRGLGGRAHRADPTEALEKAGIDDPLITSSLQSMAVWHATATDAAQRLGEANRAHDEAMQAQMQPMTDGGVQTITIDASKESGLGSLMQAATNAKVAVARINREGLDLAMASLPELAARAVRRQWLASAWPRVVGKGDPLADSFESAMAVEELTDSQRGAIAMLRVQHDEAWWTASDDIIQLQSSMSMPTLGVASSPEQHQKEWTDFERAQQNTDRMMFNRREAALKVLATLRDTLTGAQLQQVGGLPDPSPASGQHWFSH